MKNVAKKSVKPKSLSTIKKKKFKNTEIKSKKVKQLKKAVEDETVLKVEAKTVDKKLKSLKDKKKIKVSAKENVKTKDLTQKSSKKKKDKHNLEGLKDIDPEFYDFLKKNDKQLLEFNLLDSDDDEELDDKKLNKKEKKSKKSDDSDMEEGDSEEDEDEEKYHKPTGDLEVASDESDFEDEDESIVDTDSTQKITLNLLRQWQLQLDKNNVPIDSIRKVTQAFSSALLSISADSDQNVPMAYKVEGSAAFNGVIQLCVLHLQPALLRFLNVTPRSSMPLQKTKKWNKVRGCLRYYLTDLIRLVEQVSSANILSVLLKHLHQMAGMVAPFTTLGKTILKRLIVLWSTGDETVRVVAFLCILKITRNQQVNFNKLIYLV